MTGLEHYAEAERLLAPVPDPGHVLQVDNRPNPADVALAQVHATLAVVWAHNRATTELIGVLNTLLDQIRELREAQS